MQFERNLTLTHAVIIGSYLQVFFSFFERSNPKNHFPYFHLAGVLVGMQRDTKLDSHSE